MKSHMALKVLGGIVVVLLTAAAIGVPLWLGSQAQASAEARQAKSSDASADQDDSSDAADDASQKDASASKDSASDGKADTGATATSGGSASSSTSAAGTSSSQKVVIQLQDPQVAQEVSTFREMVEQGRVSSIRLIGDSITAGYGCDGWVDPNTTRTGRVVYSSDLASCYEPSADIRSWANDFRQWATSNGVSDFVNAGIVGESMATLAAEPDSWIGDGADVIFVMLGTNDEAAYTKDQFRSCAEVALANVRQKCRLMVVLAPPNNRQQGSFSAAECAQILQDVCRENGYCYVSLYDSVDLAGDEMGADGIHPTTAGSDAIWQSLSRQLGLS